MNFVFTIMSGNINSNPDYTLIKKRGRKKRSDPLVVLIVEDHEDTRFLIRMLLEMLKVRVIEAADGFQAVEAAQHNQLNLILMDGGLPGQDGITTTRLLRNNNSLNEVPIVFLSGHAEPQYMSLAKAAGCDDFQVKPFEVQQLNDVLERQLFSRGKEV